MPVRKLRRCTLCNNDRRTTNKKELFLCRKCRGIKENFKVEYGNGKLPNNFDIKHILIMMTLFEGDSKSAKQISKETKIPLKTNYRKLFELSESGLINKNDVLYSLTERSKNAILKLGDWGSWDVLKRIRKDSGIKVRFHKLQGRFYTKWSIFDYERYVRDGPDESYSNTFTKFYIGRSEKKKGIKLKFSYAVVTISSPTSICVAFSDIIIPVTETGEWVAGYAKMGEMIDLLAQKLEICFKGLEIDSFKPFGLDSQHIAILDSVYARRYYKKNGCGTQTDRFMIDNSHNKKELESIDARTAGNDFERCLEIEKRAKENDPTLKYNPYEIERLGKEDYEEMHRRTDLIKKSLE